MEGANGRCAVFVFVRERERVHEKQFGTKRKKERSERGEEMESELVDCRRMETRT